MFWNIYSADSEISSIFYIIPFLLNTCVHKNEKFKRHPRVYVDCDQELFSVLKLEIISIFFCVFFSIFRPLLKDIKSSNQHRIVLDCSTDNIYEIFKQAQQVGVMTAYDNFFVTSLVRLMFVGFSKIRNI